MLSIVNSLRDMAFGTPPTDPAGPYYPTPFDICVVRSTLIKEKSLPDHVIDTIFDFAEYWAHSSNYIDYLEEHKSALRIAGGGQMENRFLLRSVPVGLTSLKESENLTEILAYDTNEAKPLSYTQDNDHGPEVFKRLARHATPKLVYPVRKIVFTIKSRDQGWVGGQAISHKGTYKASWTWFEAGLERFDSKQECEPSCVSDLRYNSPKAPSGDLPLCSLRPVIPEVETGVKYKHELAAKPEYEIQRNRLAVRGWQEKEIVWMWNDDMDEEALDEEGRGKHTGNGEFVRSLRLGDIISVWGKARFSGWVNHVEKVKVDVFWAI